MKKLKLGIIFGGKSEEHEISILSASSFLSAVNKDKYNLVPIGINKKGDWHFVDPVRLQGIDTLGDINPDEIFLGLNKIGLSDLNKMIDFAFILVHGKFGEDGTLQGTFETLSIPYSGCGVTASSIAMDKVFAKIIWKIQGLPITEYEVVYKNEDIPDVNLPYPVFVKPANSGSSVGISKAENKAELVAGIKDAFKYDEKVLIERGIKGRELETAIIGNSSENYTCAAIGEIVTKTGFYDYDAKYNGDSAELIIPTEIASDKEKEIKKIAIDAYKALGCRGYARVDCFMEHETGNIYVNEINTIPGFTQYSMFPRLFEEAGIAYADLIDKIVGYGL